MSARAWSIGVALDAELVGDLAAVDDEGLLELVLHLEEFAHGGVDQAEGAQQQRRAWRGVWPRGWPACR